MIFRWIIIFTEVVDLYFITLIHALFGLCYIYIFTFFVIILARILFALYAHLIIRIDLIHFIFIYFKSYICTYARCCTCIFILYYIVYVCTCVA